MGCKECPYIEELIWVEENVWCDKVGGKVYLFGYCADAYITLNNLNKIHSNVEYNKYYRKQRRRNKRNRDSKYKNHIKFLSQTIQYYPSPAMPVNKYGNWNFEDPVGTVYYHRIYKGNHKRNRYKFYKKYSNRIVRRYKGEISNGCAYKKIYDFWYEVD